MSRGAIEQAEWRKRNAIRAVNDALVELRVANRLLSEAKGFPAGGLHSAGRVASDPAGASVPVLAGSAGQPLVFPPEWSR